MEHDADIFLINLVKGDRRLTFTSVAGCGIVTVRLIRKGQEEQAFQLTHEAAFQRIAGFIALGWKSAN